MVGSFVPNAVFERAGIDAGDRDQQLICHWRRSIRYRYGSGRGRQRGRCGWFGRRHLDSAGLWRGECGNWNTDADRENQRAAQERGDPFHGSAAIYS